MEYFFNHPFTLQDSTLLAAEETISGELEEKKKKEVFRPHQRGKKKSLLNTDACAMNFLDI